jgi:hypothetical protein
VGCEARLELAPQSPSRDDYAMRRLGIPTLGGEVESG